MKTVRSLSARSVTIAGTALLLVAVGLGIGGALTTPFGGCTDVGVPPDANTGFEYRGIEGGTVVYSPDGANVCQSPVEAVAVPPLVGLAGIGLLAYGRGCDGHAPARRSEA